MADQLIANKNIRIQKYVVLVAVVLFGIKLAAWMMTHSVAIYTDMLESTVNILAAVIGLYSLKFSAQPRDKNHPYGHGKVEFISAAVEGAFICAAGLAIIVKIINTYRYGHAVSNLDFGILLIVVTAVVNYLVGWTCVRQGKETGSLALVASGKHLQSDTYTTMGIILGLIFVRLTGYLWLDSLTAAIMAVIIILSGIKIMREAFAGIIDEADPKLITEVVDYLNQHRNAKWIDLHNLRIIKYGRILHFDAHMTVSGKMTVHEAHEELDRIEALFKQKYGQNIEMFIHLDPSDQDEATSSEPWTVENVISRHRHCFKPN